MLFDLAASSGTGSIIHVKLSTQPRIRRDYPLNLSILLGGGKENKYYSLSNGE